MSFIKAALLASVAIGLAACDEKVDKTVDRGFDSKDLSQLKAGIWVDPTGCDHWIIDDGVEGYLSQRLAPDGRPVCSGVAPPNTATGPFKSGSSVEDPI
ncbi:MULTISPECIES: hypothetical protein [Phaeobacter]|uniref:Outer membrane protein n=1 Tax=Phaeobacter inhibens TaxID=221822 RepID=A0A2I7KIS9_9RHOB|nr:MULTISPECIES: hypothetical protein [Phaeobacter]AFO86448.1 hypothetical protein PGA2_c04280 [Phaeobacter inhibens 2.10]APX16865.1 hypothetical protein BWR17_14155 [Phaeobacter inhibens]AUQ51139.1 Outer membrane protein [Phaeobacter inhibens]AUQ53149.1 Outer membrane protein [Phaeobacter inhibens]AUQ57378.1 Outer membrane protein [Phaeobacter inhibens]